MLSHRGTYPREERWLPSLWQQKQKEDDDGNLVAAVALVYFLSSLFVSRALCNMLRFSGFIHEERGFPMQRTQNLVDVIMRQGRGSEATEAIFCLQERKPLHSGSYEQGCQNKNNTRYPGTFFCMYVCLIQHRNWLLRSTILNAHGTYASPDGFCTRTNTHEAFSCRFYCNSFRVDRARRGNVCLSSQGMLSFRFLPSAKKAIS